MSETMTNKQLQDNCKQVQIETVTSPLEQVEDALIKSQRSLTLDRQADVALDLNSALTRLRELKGKVDVEELREAMNATDSCLQEASHADLIKWARTKNKSAQALLEFMEAEDELS